MERKRLQRVRLQAVLGLAGCLLTLRAQPAVNIQEFGGLTANPGFIAAGSDGALWFTEFIGHTDTFQIGRIDVSGKVTEFPLPSIAPSGSNINLPSFTEGPDGAVWFSYIYSGGTSNGGVIAQVTTDGQAHLFPVPSIPGGRFPIPFAIAAGPDGALWFVLSYTVGSNSTAYRLCRMTTAGTVTTQFQLPTGVTPGYLTAGPDGFLWFTDAATVVGKIDPQDGAITQYNLPAGSDAERITAGPDGALWFVEYTANKIGKITTSGIITEFPIPIAGISPISIKAGPDGALWFTEGKLNLPAPVNQIGRITTAGNITEYPLPAGDIGSGWITPGPDGALWFTEYDAEKIGRLPLSSPPPPNTNNYIITTVAGNGTAASSGDGGPATSASISVARSVAVDPAGNLYITDSGTIRKVDTSGNIKTVAGGGQQGLQGNQPATSVGLTNPWGVAVDNAGKFYIAETGGRTVDSVSAGIINIVSTQLNSPGGLAVDGSGHLYVAD